VLLYDVRIGLKGPFSPAVGYYFYYGQILKGYYFYYGQILKELSGIPYLDWE
jgi:hypothetical protein